MAIRARQQKGRPQGRGASFQRRLTWREIDSAFTHLLDVGWDDDEAQRWVFRFKRARSQLLPVFSWMVVSPYERERLTALALLERIGGAATLKMLEEILDDIDVLDAYKLDIRRLRDLLLKTHGPAVADEEEDEDEDEAGQVRRERAAATGEETGEADDSDEAGETGETGDTEEKAASAGRRGSRRSGRGRRRRKSGGETAPAAEGAATGEPIVVEEAIFDGPAEAFLALLDGPIEPVHAAFALLPLPKRLSFIDRSGRLDDERVLAFLLPLLDTAEWSLVQSALRAIGTLGRPAALPAVTALAEAAQRKRIKQRAERVRDALQEVAASLPTPEPVAEPAAAQPAEPDAGEAARPKPLRKRRGGGDRQQAEPAADATPTETAEAAESPRGARPQPKSSRRQAEEPASAGLAEWPAPLPGAASGPAEAPSRLPKLTACLAGGIAADGSQRLMVYRAGADDGVDRLYLRVHDRAGWLDSLLVCGLPADQARLDAAAAREEGRPLTEVPVGYVRRRVQEAADLGQPTGADAALAWIGGTRRAEVDADLPESPTAPSSADVDALLESDGLRAWLLPLDPGGRAVLEWLGTSGKRSASRVRRRLIDEATAAWSAAGCARRLGAWLRLQAYLWERAGQAELAATAAACAAELSHETVSPRNHLLRELVYRGFQAALDQHRAERAQAVNRARVRLARRRPQPSTARKSRRR